MFRQQPSSFRWGFLNISKNATRTLSRAPNSGIGTARVSIHLSRDLPSLHKLAIATMLLGSVEEVGLGVISQLPLVAGSSLSHELFMKTNVVSYSSNAVCKRTIICRFA